MNHRNRSVWGPRCNIERGARAWIAAALFLVSCWSGPEPLAPAGDPERAPDEQRVVIGGAPAVSAETTRAARTQPAVAPVPPGCIGTGAAATALPFEGPRFRDGTAYEYAIELSGTGEVSLQGILEAAGKLAGNQAAAATPGAADGVTRWSFALQSTVRFEVLSPGAPLRFGGRLIDPHLELSIVDGGVSDAVVDRDRLQQAADALAAQLSAPFEIQAAADGSFEQLRTSPTLPAPMASVLTTVLQEFDVPLPDAGILPAAWDSRETETSGTYHYCYVASASTPETLQVDKVRMDDVRMRWHDSRPGVADGEASASGSVRGSRSMVLDARGGFLASSRIHERLEIGRRDAGTSATQQIAGEIRLVSVSDAAASATGSPRVEASARATRFGHVSPDAGHGATVAAEPGGMDVTQQVLARLSSVPARRLEPFERFRFVQDLSTLLRGGRLPVDEIERALHGGALPDDRLPLLLAAVAHVGGPDTVPVFRCVLEDERVTDRVRLGAIAAMMHAGTPDPELVSLLQSVVRRGSPDTATTALGVIGILAHRLADSAPDASERAVAFLEAEVDAASDRRSRAVSLAALGNTGAARSRPTLLRYLEAGGEAEQGAAAYALRFFDDEEVRSALARHLRAGHDSVRVAAAEALAFRRSPEALEELTAVLASHPSESVRLAVQAQLDGWQPDDQAQPRAQRSAPASTSLLSPSDGQTLQGSYTESFGDWLAGASVEGHARASTTPGEADAEMSLTGSVTIFGDTQEAVALRAGGSIDWTAARPDLEGGLDALNLTQVRLQGFVVFTVNDLEWCSPLDLNLDLTYDAGGFWFFLLVPIHVGAEVGVGVEISEMCLGLRLLPPEARLHARATAFAVGRLSGTVDLGLIRAGVRADLRLLNVGVDGEVTADLCKVKGVVDLIFSPVRLTAELFGEACIPEICVCLFGDCVCTPEICTGASLPLIDVGADFHRVNLLDQPLVSLDFLPPFVFGVSGGGTYEHEPTVCKRDVTLAAEVWDLCDPNPAITWEEADQNLGQGSPMTATFGLGDHTVRAVATDAAGNSSKAFSFLGLDTGDVNVIDAMSPRIDFTLDTTQLWPPNGTMYRVATGIGATDVCDPAPDVAVAVTSNEPVSSSGDWAIVESAPGRWDVWLRARRLGHGNGRTYGITVTATDDWKNVSTASGSVIVDHDHGHGSP